MIYERRQSPRFPLSMEVKLSHPSMGGHLTSTQDMSDTGVYVALNQLDWPIGSRLNMQVINPAIEVPIRQAVLVRITEGKGLGLMFWPISNRKETKPFRKNSAGFV